MKANEERLNAYKEIATKSDRNMESCIRKHLEENCMKFVGNEDKFDRCIEYVTECAREILDGKNGYVADDACYAMARDYFDDEIWKKEDEEEAQRKLENERRKAELKKKQVTKPASSYEPKLAPLPPIPEPPIIDNEPKTVSKPVDGQLDLFAALGV